MHDFDCRVLAGWHALQRHHPVASCITCGSWRTKLALQAANPSAACRAEGTGQHVKLDLPQAQRQSHIRPPARHDGHCSGSHNCSMAKLHTPVDPWP